MRVGPRRRGVGSKGEAGCSVDSPSTHLRSPARLALNQAAALTLLRYVQSLFVTLIPDSRVWFSVAASP